MDGVLRILVDYRQAFASGVAVTLGLSVIIWTTGLAGGAIVGWLAHRFPRTAGAALGGLSFLSGSIPVIVVLFWAHYPLQAILGVVIDPFITAAYVLSIVNILGVAVIVRNALNSFPQQYISAAMVCGLDRATTIRSIVLPLVLREVTPSVLNIQVVMLQSTLFASMISVEEILRVSQRINATEYKPIEIFTAVAVFFMAICIPMNGAAVLLRRRFGRDLSER